MFKVLLSGRNAKRRSDLRSNPRVNVAMRKNGRRAAISLALSFAMLGSYFVAAPSELLPQAQAAEPTKDNPVLFEARGEANAGTLKYYLSILGIYATTYQSVNVIYPAELRLVAPSSISTVWNTNETDNGNTRTTNWIIKTGDRTAALLQNDLQSIYFELINSNEYPPEGSKISIRASETKQVTYADPNDFVHYYEWVPFSKPETAGANPCGGVTCKNWWEAYNLAKDKTMQDPRSTNPNDKLTGYLATITSEEEQKTLYGGIADWSGWLGGTRQMLAQPVNSTDAGVTFVAQTNPVAGNTVAIPSHQPGDLIVLVARSSTAAGPTVPAASGNVPPWTVVPGTVANASGAGAGLTVATYTATSNNHTSGTWNGATPAVTMAAFVFRSATPGVRVELKNRPLGVATNTASNTTVTYPVLEYQNNPAAVVRIDAHSVSATVPNIAGYNNLTSGLAGNIHAHWANNVTAVGSAVNATASATGFTRAVTFEIGPVKKIQDQTTIPLLATSAGTPRITTEVTRASAGYALGIGNKWYWADGPEAWAVYNNGKYTTYPRAGFYDSAGKWYATSGPGHTVYSAWDVVPADSWVVHDQDTGNNTYFVRSVSEPILANPKGKCSNSAYKNQAICESNGSAWTITQTVIADPNRGAAIGPLEFYDNPFYCAGNDTPANSGCTAVKNYPVTGVYNNFSNPADGGQHYFHPDKTYVGTYPPPSGRAEPNGGNLEYTLQFAYGGAANSDLPKSENIYCTEYYTSRALAVPSEVGPGKESVPSSTYCYANVKTPYKTGWYSSFGLTKPGTVTEDANGKPDTWNDYAGFNTSSLYGYFIEWGGYPGDPTVDELTGEGVLASSDIEVPLPIQIQYRSDRVIGADAKGYNLYEEISEIGIAKDTVLNYMEHKPYNAPRNNGITAAVPAHCSDGAYLIESTCIAANKTWVPLESAKPAIPAGYEPYGWYFAGDSEDAIKTELQPNGSVNGEFSSRNQRIVFLYRAKDYTVNFDPNWVGANSSNVSPASKTVKYDLPYGAMADATRPGYTFTGWYTPGTYNGDGTYATPAPNKKESTDLYLPDLGLNPTGNTTLYAGWTPTNYLVKYDLDGGTLEGSPTIADKSVTWFDNNLLPGGVLARGADASAPDGYVFTGWNVVANGSQQNVNDSDSYDQLALSDTENSITLKAQWRDAHYIYVFYQLNDGYTAYPLIDQTYEKGDRVVPIPGLPGAGVCSDPQWAVETDCTDDGGTWTSYGEPTKLGARFHDWHLTDKGFGPVQDRVNDLYSPGSTDYGDLAMCDADLVTEGKCTLGQIGSYIVLWAHWVPIKYYVHFDANYPGNTFGTPSIANVTWDDNGLVPAPGGNPTPPARKVFIGWNTKPDGSGIAVEPGTTYGTLAAGDDQWHNGEGQVEIAPNLFEKAILDADSNVIGNCLWNANRDPLAAPPQPWATCPGVTLYAQWLSEPAYLVKYDLNGGTIAGATTVPAIEAYLGDDHLLPATNVSVPPITEPVGYEFSGWAVVDNGSKSPVLETDTFGSLATDPNLGYITLRAQFAAKSGYTVRYDKNSTDPNTKWFNNVVPLNHTKTGFPCVDDATALCTVAWGQSYLLPAASDPVWNHNQTTGTVNGTTCTSAVPCVVVDYTFIGWNTKANGTGVWASNSKTYGELAGGDDTRPGEPGFDGKVILYAQWAPVSQYTVTFDLNGGTGTANNLTLTSSAAPVTLPATNPTKTGYTFVRWTVIDDGYGNNYTNNTSPSVAAQYNVANNTPYNLLSTGVGTPGWRNIINLRAIYQENANYTVTYNWNDGIVTTESETRSPGIKWSDTGFVPHAASRPGYNPLGWTLDQAGLTTPVIAGDSYAKLATQYCAAMNLNVPASCPKADALTNITLYAQWEKGSFTVLYDINGGSYRAPLTAEDYAANHEVSFDQDHLTKPALDRRGYTFAGWKASECNKSSDFVYDTHKYSDLAASGCIYVKLQAQWTEKSYTVKYDLNGATSVNGITVSPAVADLTPVRLWSTGLVPTDDVRRAGYTLKVPSGWMVSKAGPTTFATPSREVTSADSYNDLLVSTLGAGAMDYDTIWLQAQWDGKIYTVNYDLSTCPNKVPDVWTATVAAKSGKLWDSANLLPTTAPVCPGYQLSPEWTLTMRDGAAYSPVITLTTSTAYKMLTGGVAPIYNDEVRAITIAPIWVEGDAVTYNYSAQSFKSNLDPAATPTAGGTVAPATGTILPVSPPNGNGAKSVATEAPGYTFEGWFAAADTDFEDQLEDQATFTPVKDANGLFTGGSYVARFVEDGDVAVNYTKVSYASGVNPAVKGTGGSISREDESLAPASGTPTGAVASVTPGYAFVKWCEWEDYNGVGLIAGTGFDCTSLTAETEFGSGVYLANLVPTKGMLSQVYEGKTYVAIFQESPKVTVTYQVATKASNGVVVEIAANTTSGGTIDKPGNVSLAPASDPASAAQVVATPAAGYEFEGWYKATAGPGYDLPAFDDDPTLTPERTGSGLWQTDSYVAVFREKANVTLNYQVKTLTSGWETQSAIGGTVSASTRSVAPATGVPDAVVASDPTGTGYTFEGWFTSNATWDAGHLVTGSKLSTACPSFSCVPTKAADTEWANGTTYLAVFREDPTVTISYALKTFDSFGDPLTTSTDFSLTRTSETVPPASTRAQGATAATTNTDYAFVGWFIASEVGDTLPITTPLSGNEVFNPTACTTVEPLVCDLNVAGSYVAVYREREPWEANYTAKTYSYPGGLVDTGTAVSGGSIVLEGTPVPCGPVSPAVLCEWVAPSTGTPQGASATINPNNGYEFLGWYDAAQLAGGTLPDLTGLPRLDTSVPGTYAPASVTSNVSYVAVFKELENRTITYGIATYLNGATDDAAATPVFSSTAPAGAGGTISTIGGSIPRVSVEPVSTATANTGYTFVKWCAAPVSGDLQFDCTPVSVGTSVEVEPGVFVTSYNPMLKPNPSWPTAANSDGSYVAVFQENPDVTLAFITRVYYSGGGLVDSGVITGGGFTSASATCTPAVSTSTPAGHIDCPIAPVTGTFTNVTAAETDGYTWQGWYDSTNTLVTMDRALNLTRPGAQWNTATYQARFKENPDEQFTYGAVTFVHDGDTYGSVGAADNTKLIWVPGTEPANKVTLNAVPTTACGALCEKVAPASGTPVGAQRQQHSSYTFLGWYPASLVQTWVIGGSLPLTWDGSAWVAPAGGITAGVTGTELVPVVGADGIYHSGDFVAVYYESVPSTSTYRAVTLNNDATGTMQSLAFAVTYRAGQADGGSLALATKAVQCASSDALCEWAAPATGTAWGAVANANKAGYEFVGWYQLPTLLSTSTKLGDLTVADNYVAGTLGYAAGPNTGNPADDYLAVFRELPNRSITYNSASRSNLGADLAADAGGKVLVNGTVMPSTGLTVAVAPVTGTEVQAAGYVPGAQITAGFEFTGWYLATDTDFDNPLATCVAEPPTNTPCVKGNVIVPQKNTDGTWKAGTSYVALFTEKADVTLTYQVRTLNTDTGSLVVGGTVSKSSETLHPALSGGPAPTVTAARANTGYDFIGWCTLADFESDLADCADTPLPGASTPAVTGGTLALPKPTSGEWATATYVAVFQERGPVTINYSTLTFDVNVDVTEYDFDSLATLAGLHWNYASGSIGGCLVLPGTTTPCDPTKSQSLAPATGSATGATAVASSKYVFVGWFEKPASAVPWTSLDTTPWAAVTALGGMDGTKLIPATDTDGLNVAKEYVAVFREEVPVEIAYSVATFNQDDTAATVTTSGGTVALRPAALPCPPSAAVCEWVAPLSGTAGGANAEEKAGFTFLGWYLKGVTPWATTDDLPEDEADGASGVSIVPVKSGTGNVPAEYVAVFQENGPVTLTYKVATKTNLGAPAADLNAGGTLQTSKLSGKLINDPVPPASGTPEVTAIPADGYSFVGWYRADDTAFATKLTASDVFQPAKPGASPVYTAATYVALFQEDADVTLTYQVVTLDENGDLLPAPAVGGTISSPAQTLAPATGTQTPVSVVKANNGYTFQGWYVQRTDSSDNEAGGYLDPANALSPLSGGAATLTLAKPTPIWDDATYVAVFQEGTHKTITYSAAHFHTVAGAVVTDYDSVIWTRNDAIAGGSVALFSGTGLCGTKPCEDVPLASATPVGAVASVGAAGYEFVGWFPVATVTGWTDEVLASVLMSGTGKVSSAAHYVPAPDANGLNFTAEYIAVYRAKVPAESTYTAATFDNAGNLVKALLLDNPGGTLLLNTNAYRCPPAAGKLCEWVQVSAAGGAHPKGATAFAQPGYDFKGWYRVPDPVLGDTYAKLLDTISSGTWLTNATAFLGANPVSGENKAGAYVAVFQEQADVELTYTVATTTTTGAVVAPSAGGSITATAVGTPFSIAPASGTVAQASASVVAEKPGYQFDGWYAVSDLTTRLSANKALFTPAKTGDLWTTGEYVALFVEKPAVKLNFAVVTLDNAGTATGTSAGGSVSTASATVNPVTGPASVPVTATRANAGYTFLGWFPASYTVGDVRQDSGDDTSGTLTLNQSAQTGGVWSAVTWVAVFQENAPETILYSATTFVLKDGSAPAGHAIATQSWTPGSVNVGTVQLVNGKSDVCLVPLTTNSVPCESVPPASVPAAGATASTTVSNYRFVGWFPAATVKAWGLEMPTGTPDPITHQIVIPGQVGGTATWAPEPDPLNVAAHYVAVFREIDPFEVTYTAVTYDSNENWVDSYLATPGGGLALTAGNACTAGSAYLCEWVSTSPAGIVNGAKATANPGYKFLGWFKVPATGLDNVSLATLRGVGQVAAATQYTYVPPKGTTTAAYVAVFQEKPPATITLATQTINYTAADLTGTLQTPANRGGSATPVGTYQVPPVTGTVGTSSTAAAANGYQFIGWFKASDGPVFNLANKLVACPSVVAGVATPACVDASGIQITPARDADGLWVNGSYVALFQEKPPVTLTFDTRTIHSPAGDALAGGGSINLDNTELAPATGSASGIVVQATTVDPGYTFKGWYSSDATFDASGALLTGTQLQTGANFTPTRVGELWTDTTYLAVFAEGANVTIKYSVESFRVLKPSDPGYDSENLTWIQSPTPVGGEVALNPGYYGAGVCAGLPCESAALVSKLPAGATASVKPGTAYSFVGWYRRADIATWSGLTLDDLAGKQLGVLDGAVGTILVPEQGSDGMSHTAEYVAVFRERRAFESNYTVQTVDKDGKWQNSYTDAIGAGGTIEPLFSPTQQACPAAQALCEWAAPAPTAANPTGIWPAGVTAQVLPALVDGYDFVGWYDRTGKDPNLHEPPINLADFGPRIDIPELPGSYLNKLVSPAFAPSNDVVADPNIESGWYVAVFQERDDVTIHYQTATRDGNGLVGPADSLTSIGGTIAALGKDIAPASGLATSAQGNVATVTPGYRFDGWYAASDNTFTTRLSDSLTFTPAKPGAVWPAAPNELTFVALFVENDNVNVKFQVRTLNSALGTSQAGGTVTLGTETSDTRVTKAVAPATSLADFTVTAIAKTPGYTFKGWYTSDTTFDAAGNKLTGDQLQPGSAPAFTPTKAQGGNPDLWLNTIYLAVFEEGADQTITYSVAEFVPEPTGGTIDPATVPWHRAAPSGLNSVAVTGKPAGQSVTETVALVSGSTLGAKATPTGTDDYTFLGWYRVPTGLDWSIGAGITLDDVLSELVTETDLNLLPGKSGAGVYEAAEYLAVFRQRQPFEAVYTAMTLPPLGAITPLNELGLDTSGGVIGLETTAKPCLGAVDELCEWVQAGTATQGAIATAKLDYDFLGWYAVPVGGVTATTTLADLGTVLAAGPGGVPSAKFAPSNTAGTHAAFVAVFQEHEDIVPITYTAIPARMGTLDADLADTQVRVKSGTPEVTATAKAGYELLGWCLASNWVTVGHVDYLPGQPDYCKDGWIGTGVNPGDATVTFGTTFPERADGTTGYGSATLVPAKHSGTGYWLANDYVVVFREIPHITISYAIADGGGVVSRTSESFNPVTGKATGTRATPNQDFGFVGWCLKQNFITDVADPDRYTCIGGWIGDPWVEPPTPDLWEKSGAYLTPPAPAFPDEWTNLEYVARFDRRCEVPGLEAIWSHDPLCVYPVDPGQPPVGPKITLTYVPNWVPNAPDTGFAAGYLASTEYPAPTENSVPTWVPIYDRGMLSPRYGMKFLGWSENPSATTPDLAVNGKPAWDPGSIVALTHSVTLYAVWAANTPSSVTYYNGCADASCLVYKSETPVGGLATVWDRQLQPAGTSMPAPYNPPTAAPGLVWGDFLGWSTTPGATVPDPAFADGNEFRVTQPMELYAVWSMVKTVTIPGTGEVIENPPWAPPGTPIPVVPCTDPLVVSGKCIVPDPADPTKEIPLVEDTPGVWVVDLDEDGTPEWTVTITPPTPPVDVVVEVIVDDHGTVLDCPADDPAHPGLVCVPVEDPSHPGTAKVAYPVSYNKTRGILAPWQSSSSTMSGYTPDEVTWLTALGYFVDWYQELRFKDEVNSMSWYNALELERVGGILPGIEWAFIGDQYPIHAVETVMGMAGELTSILPPYGEHFAGWAMGTPKDQPDFEWSQSGNCYVDLRIGSARYGMCALIEITEPTVFYAVWEENDRYELVYHPLNGETSSQRYVLQPHPVLGETEYIVNPPGSHLEHTWVDVMDGSVLTPPHHSQVFLGWSWFDPRKHSTSRCYVPRDELSATASYLEVLLRVSKTLVNHPDPCPVAKNQAEEPVDTNVVISRISAQVSPVTERFMAVPAVAPIPQMRVTLASFMVPAAPPKAPKGYIELYAVWSDPKCDPDEVLSGGTCVPKPVSYDVTYYAPGASGTVLGIAIGVPPIVTYPAGSWVAVASGAGLNMPGYEFLGWATASDGPVTYHADGKGGLFTGFVMPDKPVKLYAKWTPIGSGGGCIVDCGSPGGGGPGGGGPGGGGPGGGTVLPGAGSMTPGTMPKGIVGGPYTQQLIVTGIGNATCVVNGGALPPGLSLDPATCLISGTPTQTGSYTFTVRATGPGGTVSRTYTIVVGTVPSAPSSSGSKVKVGPGGSAGQPSGPGAGTGSGTGSGAGQNGETGVGPNSGPGSGTGGSSDELLLTTGEEPTSGSEEAPLLTTGDGVTNSPATAGGLGGFVARLSTGSWALLNLLLTLGAIFLALACGWLGLRYRLYQRREVEVEPVTYDSYLANGYAQAARQGEASLVANEQESRRKDAIRSLVLSLLSAFGAAVLWIVTQVITGRMVWVDRWTLLFAALFALTLFVYLRHRHTAHELGDLDDQQADLADVMDSR